MTSSIRAPSSGRCTVAAHLEVLLHGERVEHVVVLGHVAEAKPAKRCVRTLAISLPSSLTWPTLTRRRPATALSIVLLPAPLGPTTVTISPVPTWALTPRMMGGPP